MSAHEAVLLFVDRACAARPDFILTAQNAPVVTKVCEDLDGIPLAIELAAARLRALNVDQIAAHLAERFKLLIGGSRTALPRHQTLHGLIDWSYELLSESERKILRRLSVFAGGWSLEAAEQVCGEGSNSDVLTRLIELIDKSLVVADDLGSKTRYRLHETIRAYAREKLVAAGETALIAGRHTGYYLAFAEQAEQYLISKLQGEYLELLDTEHDNLRAALESSRMRGDVQTSLRLAGALWRFWFLHGYFDEGRRVTDAVLADPRGAPALRAKVLVGAGLQAVFTGEYTRGEVLCREGLEAAREACDKALTALSLILLADSQSFLTYNLNQAVALHAEGLALAQTLGNRWLYSFALAEYWESLRNQRYDEQTIHQTVTHLQDSLVLARESGDRWLIAFVLFRLGSAMTASGDFASARACHEEGLAIRHAMGDRLGIAYALLGMARTAEAQGDYAVAQAYLLERLALERELGSRTGVCYSLTDLGLLAMRQGEYTQAQAHLEESESLFGQDPHHAAFQHLCIALVGLLQGDYGKAKRFLVEILTLSSAYPAFIMSALEAFGRMAAAQGLSARAARLFGAVEAMSVTASIRRFSTSLE